MMRQSNAPIDIARSAEKQRIVWELNSPLANYTTFRLGGPCPLLLYCETPMDLIHAVELMNERMQEFMLIGGGSNLLVSDDGLDKMVLRYLSESPQIKEESGMYLNVSGSTLLDDLVAYTVENGWAEMVNASGIPGTVGGGIAGNAGAFGWDLSQALVRLKIMDYKGGIDDVKAREILFRYRYSSLQEQVVLSAQFRLPRGNKAELKQERERILALRREKHPDLQSCPCAGSFFRNIESTSKAKRRQAAGHFLEKSGAKSMRVGSAAVFIKHANIIIKEDATCRAQDVLDLSMKMAQAVQECYGIKLIREVRPVGRFREMSY